MSKENETNKESTLDESPELYGTEETIVPAEVLETMNKYRSEGSAGSLESVEDEATSEDASEDVVDNNEEDATENDEGVKDGGVGDSTGESEEGEEGAEDVETEPVPQEHITI